MIIETKPLALDCPAQNPVLTHLLQRVSTLHQLLRATAWIKRHISNLQKRCHRQHGPLSTMETASARFLWEKATQQQHYPDVLARTSSKQQHPLIQPFDLFLDDDGLLRCGGRLKHADLPTSAKHRVLLPPTDLFTHHVIIDLHQSCSTSGQRTR